MSWLSEAFKRNKTAIAGIVRAVPVVGGVASSIIAGSGGGSKATSVTQAIKGEFDSRVDAAVADARVAATVIRAGQSANDTFAKVKELARDPLVWVVGIGGVLAWHGLKGRR